jgi:hypothetical protein
MMKYYWKLLNYSFYVMAFLFAVLAGIYGGGLDRPGMCVFTAMMSVFFAFVSVIFQNIGRKR